MRNSTRQPFHPTQRLKAATTILAALALVGLSISPAVAAGGPQTTTEEYAFETWTCGYPMQVEGEATSRLRERSDPRGSGLPSRWSNVKYAETWTNSAGDSFSRSGRRSRRT